MNYKFYVLVLAIPHNSHNNVASSDVFTCVKIKLISLSYIATFLPNTSIAINRYRIRKARLQPPLYVHEYIPKTCKHKLPVYLNSINSNNNELSRIISITDKISLSSFKNRIKMCLLESYSY